MEEIKQNEFTLAEVAQNCNDTVVSMREKLHALIDIAVLFQNKADEFAKDSADERTFVYNISKDIDLCVTVIARELNLFVGGVSTYLQYMQKCIQQKQQETIVQETPEEQEQKTL
jgi:hypothetical protein